LSGPIKPGFIENEFEILSFTSILSHQIKENKILRFFDEKSKSNSNKYPDHYMYMYRNIKCHSNYRELYWIEGRGNNYTIKAGTLDGSSEKAIVNSDSLKKPSGLFYHIEKNR
jgi:hypothetical protein